MRARKEAMVSLENRHRIGQGDVALAGMMGRVCEINIAITPATTAEDVVLGTVSLCAIHPAVNSRKNEQKMNVERGS